MSCHIKIGLDRFSRFDFYLIQITADKHAKFIFTRFLNKFLNVSKLGFFGVKNCLVQFKFFCGYRMWILSTVLIIYSLSYKIKEGEGEPCPHCNNWFTTKSVLSLHMRDAHNDRLLTKKEVEVTMNRMRRQMEEQRKVNLYFRIFEKKIFLFKINHLSLRDLYMICGKIFWFVCYLNPWFWLIDWLIDC